MSSFRLIVGIVLLGAIGCMGPQVSTKDVVGTWTVTSDSRQRLPRSIRSAAATITLDSNGTFVASEIPNELLYGPPDAGQATVTGNGTWHLSFTGSKQQIQLNFQTITTGQKSSLPYGTQLNVTGRQASLKLFYFQGDPDQAKRIEFDRKSSSTNAS